MTSYALDCTGIPSWKNSVSYTNLSSTATDYRYDAANGAEVVWNNILWKTWNANAGSEPTASNTSWTNMGTCNTGTASNTVGAIISQLPFEITTTSATQTDRNNQTASSITINKTAGSDRSSLALEAGQLRIDRAAQGAGGTTIISYNTVQTDVITANKYITAPTWKIPDYVFEKDYKLKSLSETEKFVKLNKHLPEIPNAEQIKNSGMDLVQMNVLLLKKVEELTLHTIELDKKIKNQQIQINHLNKGRP